MAVRNFDYAEAKDTMTKIQGQAEAIKKYLNTCQTIIDENVGVKGRWSGERATAFKQRWERTSADFQNFVQMINQYANKVDESYRVHQQFDQAN